jgi:hypothetical protein
MNALTSRDLEATDMLALARLDDDGAPPAVTRPQVGVSHERDAIRCGGSQTAADGTRT